MKPKLIVVLGMHRAGTSAVTRGLEVLSVSLGTELMAPMEYVNPKGFFEDLQIVDLNEQVLKAIDCDWKSVLPVNTSHLDLLKQLGYLSRAVELLKDKSRGAAVFGFKDPRVTKLLPFWNQVFDALGYEVGFVLTLRNPLSIAKSLEKRDGMQASHSFYLWLCHMLESLRGSQGHPRLVIDYDELIKSPGTQINRIASALDLEVDEIALQTYVKEFLDQTLRHTTYSSEDLLTERYCPALAKEVFDWLYQAATEQISLEDERFQVTSASWVSEFERLKVSLELIDGQLSHIAQLSQANLSQENNIAELKQTVADQHAMISSLTDKAEALKQWSLELQRELDETRAMKMQILNSKSWRLTSSLRGARRWLAKLK